MSFNFAAKNKTGSAFSFKLPAEAPYVTLSELLEANGGDFSIVYTVRALYINTRGKFGPQPLAALDECYVNLPKHKCDDVTDFLSDPAAVEAINAGSCGFRIREYQDRNNVDRLSINWVNCD